MTTKRLSKDDWLEVALKRLAMVGPDALTVEQICDAAGKTKGSFYHHFTDHAVFLRAVVDAWRRRCTRALIESAEAQRDAQASLKQLNRQVLELDEDLERGVRSLAAQKAELQALVSGVDAERVGYLAELHKKWAPEMSDEARRIAEVEYAAFIGHLTIWPDASKADRKRAAGAFDALVRRAYRDRDP